MLIREFLDTKVAPDADKAAAITKFLIGRAKDESARKQMSQDAYIQALKSVGVEVTPENLGDMVNQEPLKNLLEPVEPNSGVVRFKGDTDVATGMSVDQARAVVDSNAKAAMKRRQ